MKTSNAILAAAIIVGLSACDRPVAVTPAAVLAVPVAVPGPPGAPGATGATGSAGTAGPTGAVGATGSTGATGTPGESGASEPPANPGTTVVIVPAPAPKN
jgi:hypothetical protein